ncbi:PP2C family protein-serine/threonine phosphatase [Streptomyces marispadix]|uniref:SpoIIE family protein phosphatase n=1 Tax=Streptomyces marispadix TaxID=2922868 RepID=A0ABS9SUV1_9ACTN|nr:SpoIIE family protein phosphatase [Streptomyces marispadix]MCH6160050.1 SpoIIE family protein phosphatase [Streptomyces marispadix]
MTGSEIDYAAIFAALPSPYVVLDPDLVIRDVNRVYLRSTGRSREGLLGQYFFDAFPPNPREAVSEGVQKLRSSLLRAVEGGRVDSMAPVKYDIPVASRPGVFEERWWSPINTPVLDGDGNVVWVIHRVEDVTAFVHARRSARAEEQAPQRHEGRAAEIYTRAQELETLNDELRMAHDRESRVALTLQEALLYSPDLPRAGVAVRYLPAVGTLNVCGDWYDVTDVPEVGGFTAAVGDVVGHGLEAAGVMGMLRSALNAAMRATASPARALQILGLYANSVEGAQSATAVKVRVDSGRQTITYSSAGHLPPVLMHAAGDCELLDQATDPPLATRSEHEPRPEARAHYDPGDCLILYTDGLVERRDESIDEGIGRLTEVLASCAGGDAEEVADEVLAGMGVMEGAADDIALVIISL